MRKKIKGFYIFYFILFSVLIFGCKEIVNPTEFFAHLEGYVVDSLTQQPLKDVRVFTSDNQNVSLTDSNGVYKLLRVHLGSTTGIVCLNATKDNYFPYQKNMTLQYNQVYFVRIALIPK